jgi:cytochrome b6-f complex iron-sulfur subunit
MSGRLDPQPIPRRDFLGMAGLWSAAIAIFGSVVGMAQLPKPRVLPEASGTVKVGPASAYPAGTIKVFSDQRIRVISTPTGVAAMSLICTHLGCVVSENSDGFHCPCHGSKFDLEGYVLGGPAPRALHWLPISRAADGSLLVDTKGDVPPGTFYEV